MENRLKKIYESVANEGRKYLEKIKNKKIKDYTLKDHMFLIEQSELAIGWDDEKTKLISMNAGLGANNARYRKALEFYADEKSWELGDPYEPRDCKAWRDHGEIARKELEQDQ